MLKIIRYDKENGAVLGLCFQDGRFICYTLENEKKMIPAGTFALGKHVGGKYDKICNTYIKNYKGMPLINVPGRKYILIHPGNKYSDSEGCILCGWGVKLDMITNSRDAFIACYDIFMSEKTIEIVEI